MAANACVKHLTNRPCVRHIGTLMHHHR